MDALAGTLAPGHWLLAKVTLPGHGGCIGLELRGVLVTFGLCCIALARLLGLGSLRRKSVSEIGGRQRPGWEENRGASHVTATHLVGEYIYMCVCVCVCIKQAVKEMLVTGKGRFGIVHGLLTRRGEAVQKRWKEGKCAHSGTCRRRSGSSPVRFKTAVGRFPGSC